MNFSFYSNFLNGLTNQEAQIALLQQQIATGSTVQNAAQNPSAYEVAALANDQIGQLNDDTLTQSNLQTRLGSANSAYSSMNTLLNNVQSILEQSMNGATNSKNLNALSTQVQSASQQLLSLANTQLPNGNYLFGGSRGNIAPFQTDTSGNIAYFGDSAQSLANIDPTTTANTLVSGDVLTSALSGNGTSFIAAASSNTGTGQILQQGLGNISQANAFQAGSNGITISFSTNTDGTINYTATQVAGQFSTVNGASVFTPTPGGAATVLKTGSLNTTSGNPNDLTIDGMNFNITGSPANGDSFTIAPSRPQTAFSLLQGISQALSGTQSTEAQTAQTNQELNQYLSGIEQYQQNVTVSQAQNAITIQAVTASQTDTSTQENADQTTINNATAVNMPAAITALNQAMIAIEASMKTFADAQSLSLFKYL